MNYYHRRLPVARVTRTDQRANAEAEIKKSATYVSSHPEVAGRTHEIKVTRGRWTTEDGLPTEVIHATIVEGNGITGYEPSQDTHLYEYRLAEE